ncbi:MAG: hypothetical protein ATN36_05045 [Epulopiscium sp. Nele67-Bin005]|nr:MAG: hypothetical protein ATN36_05045 [Epulopiscium sp. Nele67-Bin005]
MKFDLNLTQINQTKTELSLLLCNKDFDFLSPEILQLSQKLDEQMLPEFRQQLNFYNYTLSTYTNFKFCK